MTATSSAWIVLTNAWQCTPRKFFATTFIAIVLLAILIYTATVSPTDISTRQPTVYNMESWCEQFGGDIRNTVNTVIDKCQEYKSNIKTNKEISRNKSRLLSKSSDSKKYVQRYSKEIVDHPPDEKCKKRLPQAIVAGIQKSGTTALLFFLNLHPQIAAVLIPQEVQYFTTHYAEGLGWYRKAMECSFSNQITMEKSPPYFYRGFCAKRIRNMNKTTKIILTVKDPITRSLSMFSMMHRDISNRPSFENVVTDKATGEINGKNRLISWSIYSNFIIPWIREMGLKQLHFVDGNNLEIDPAFELQKVEEFLDIGTFFSPDRFAFNESKNKYCVVNVDSAEGMLCLGQNKGRVHPEITDQFRIKLQDFFRPFNSKFFKLINRNFDWGY